MCQKDRCTRKDILEVALTREQVLDKLKKLVAMAKSAEAIGSEKEAMAFAVKVQELLSEHKISMSEVEYKDSDNADPVDMHQVDFASAGIKVKSGRVFWQEQLAHTVCSAYFCRVIVKTGSSRLYFVGRDSDFTAAEQVFLYLCRVAMRLVDVEYVRYFYECRKAGTVELARGFRKSYLSSFSNRLDERYREERERIKREHASSMTALVRLEDAVTVVGNYMKKLRSSGRTQRAGNLSPSEQDQNEEGMRRGKRDANMVPIGQDTVQIGDVK